MGRILTPKIMLLLAIIIGCGYLVSKFPDQSILIGSLAIIILIGYWLYQAYHQG